MEMEIKGLEDVVRQLGDLPNKVGKKIIRQALRKASRPILETAKQWCPEDTGQLRDSIKLRAIKRSRSGRIGIRVSCSDQEYVGRQFYGAFQELGYHVGKRGNPDRRKIEGQHFLKFAYEAQGEKARDIAEKEIMDGIQRESTK